MKDLDVYEKHFTVMNYSESSHLEQMFCHDFIKKFEEQYPGFKWDKIELDIFGFQSSILSPFGFPPLRASDCCVVVIVVAVVLLFV